jgi:hypothetical protein
MHAGYESAASFWPDESRPESVELHFKVGWQADALHRSIIEAGHRAITICVHELVGRPDRFSLVPFMCSTNAASLRDFDTWHYLYCLAIYRNKVVTHHDVPRMSGTMTDASGTRRLTPLPAEFHISEVHVQRLYAIRDQTGVGTELSNHFEVLERLFYGLPVELGTRQSPAREEVNEIAEHGGVKSPSVSEVLTWVEAGCVDALTNA